MDNTARLLITCPDRPGIIAAMAGFFHNHGANITAFDQHATRAEGGVFFTRLEFHTPYLDLTKQALEHAFQEVVADRFEMDWRLSYSADVKKVALLVSRQDHAMLDLLWRWKRGRLPAEVTMVISNHETLRGAVETFGVPFHYVPVEKDNKSDSEARILELLADNADLVVLARYMQILSSDFVELYPHRIINIHHSFLPAFVGASPYRQAYERGVKIIGATAHYVIPELDAGPIIEQDVVRVDHRHLVEHLVDLGRGIEREVLARAVKWHLEDRVIVYGNKTVVFA